MELEVIFIDISELTVRLLVLFLPGIIATNTIDLLTTHRKRQPYQFVLHSYLIGAASYMILSFFVYLNNRLVEFHNEVPTWKVTFLTSLLNNKSAIIWTEVFFASVVGFILAIIIVKIINEKMIYRVANFLNISNKHGDDDVWDYLFSSEEVEWITVRDADTKIVYVGAVSTYSQKDEKRELILSQVEVYKEIGNNQPLKDLYSLNNLYLSFDVNSKIIIEIN